MQEEPSWWELILIFVVILGVPTFFAGLLIIGVTGLVVGLRARRRERCKPP